MRAIVFAAAAAGLVGLAACEARQTQEGELPDVDVQAEGGQVPKYDVDPAVDVEMREKTVTVPDVDIPTEKEKVEVPVITEE